MDGREAAAALRLRERCQPGPPGEVRRGLRLGRARVADGVVGPLVKRQVPASKKRECDFNKDLGARVLCHDVKVPTDLQIKLARVLLFSCRLFLTQPFPQRGFRIELKLLR